MVGASGTHPGPYTWSDFVALPEDDRRELIDGELVETEVPSYAHEAIVVQIVSLLNRWCAATGAGVTLASGAKTRISERRGVMPDAQLFLTEGERASRRPFVVVEIQSPSSRRYDRVVKLGYYASLGVPEYWIVDPEACAFERLVLHGDRYTIADALADDAVVRPESLEGLELPLGELWAAAQRARALE
jgi:Uma2 family endonuclease